MSILLKKKINLLFNYKYIILKLKDLSIIHLLSFIIFKYLSKYLVFYFYIFIDFQSIIKVKKLYHFFQKFLLFRILNKKNGIA